MRYAKPTTVRFTEDEEALIQAAIAFRAADGGRFGRSDVIRKCLKALTPPVGALSAEAAEWRRAHAKVFGQPKT